ncbi:(Fe-S)-binding protein [Sulfuracidifex tepidarius]|nr:(Fe-S)-binding protein [Sulfuracidifex tepidarius]
MDDAIKQFLFSNMKQDFVPFPVDKSICTGWAEGEKKGGETILYTGCMYQLAPLSAIFNRVSRVVSRVSSPQSILRMAKRVHPEKRELERSYKILRNISSILRKNGVNFGYLFEDEPYSGAFLLELGMLDEFEEYARLVKDKLLSMGVKRIITVDPHSQNALSRYSEFFTFDIEVVSYLDLVKDIVKSSKKGTYVIHDSCLYSRFMNKRDVYRSILEKGGISVKEDYMVTSRENSLCCGGPLAPINESLSSEIGKYRATQLKGVSDKVIVQCPFCYMNLSPYVETYDIAEVISCE